MKKQLLKVSPIALMPFLHTTKLASKHKCDPIGGGNMSSILFNCRNKQRKKVLLICDIEAASDG